MFMIVRVMILVGFVKLLIATERPLLCAGLYTVFRFTFALMFGGELVQVLIFSAVAFAFAYLYFWLLNRFQEGVLFWVIAIVGAGIGLV